MTEEKDQIERLSEGDSKVVEALRALPTVTAPDDFEFRVKARIAEREASKVALIFGIPRRLFVFAAVLVVVAGTAVTIVTRRAGEDVAVTREVERSVPPVASEAPAAPPVVFMPDKTDVARNEANASTNSAGGVSEQAAKPPHTGDIGPGSKQPLAGERGESAGVAESLSSKGIQVVFENGGWTVKAAAMGLKEGDVIVSIDGVTVSRDTRLSSPFTGRMLLVRRGGSDKLLPVPIG